MPTGKVEMVADSVEIISAAAPLPLLMTDEDGEEVRLKYRYLDLRRPRLQRNLRLRSQLVGAIRQFLDARDFIDAETPILTRATPEGARDYLVPSRVQTGSFYALPQSPQLFKQLLMMAGLDKYYQVARCFRDEDSRADRQPEFTQLDMEMSFVEPEDVQAVVEGAFAKVFKTVKNIDIPLPLPRMTWRQAVDGYGSGTPDTRFGMKLKDVTDVVRGCGFGVFDNAVSVRGINAEGGAAHLSRKEIDALGELAKTYHVKGLAWLTIAADGTVKSSFAKFMSEEK